ncbi:hypothetical protein GCM10010968_24740 [Agrococcus terreus]|uniref:Uncharacterized protein n=1 Tax=Agrococcus terreus TaxID=574649 RepID=A0ABQ2KPV6_9MICO|nr:hypothetical protein GCM10010968_24740 [Agrococcus terreus]
MTFTWPPRQAAVAADRVFVIRTAQIHASRRTLSLIGSSCPSSRSSHDRLLAGGRVRSQGRFDARAVAFTIPMALGIAINGLPR